MVGSRVKKQPSKTKQYLRQNDMPLFFQNDFYGRFQIVK
jgi:hypothetical protein